MVGGSDEKVNEDFELLTKQKAKRIVNQFIINKKMQDRIVNIIKDEAITGFILKDIMKTSFNFTDIEKNLKEKMSEQNSIHDSKVLQIFTQKEEEEKKKEETEEEKKTRRGLPDQDIEALLKEFKCEDNIPKLKEHAIDKKQFWELELDQLKELLGIEIFGRRKKLFAKMGAIKKEHDEQMDELKKLEDDIDKGGLVELLKRASTSIMEKKK